jgi:hypothetical protein
VKQSLFGSTPVGTNHVRPAYDQQSYEAGSCLPVVLALSVCGCGGAETIAVTTTETVTGIETRAVRTVTVTETVANHAKPSPSRLVFVPVRERLLYMPHSIGLGGPPDVTDIRWIRYGGATALAAGIFHQRDCSRIRFDRCDLYELHGAQIPDDGADVLSFEIDCSRSPLTAGQRRADP